MTTFQTTLNSRLFPDFTSGDSNIAFDERFNDNITYSTGCFIHEQKKHQLCFNELLCQIVGKEKPLKISENVLFQFLKNKAKTPFHYSTYLHLWACKTDYGSPDFFPTFPHFP